MDPAETATAVDTAPVDDGLGTNVPAFPTADTPSDADTSFLDSLPEEYREKEWVKQFKDMNGLLKSQEDTKAALSRRPSGIPDDNASDADKAAFHKALGVPDTPDGYKLADMPEGYEPTEADTKYHTEVKQLFHDSKISPSQAVALEAGWAKMMEGYSGDSEARQAKLDTDFDTLTTDLYGDQRDTVLAQGKALISAHADEKVKPFINELSNNALAVLSSVLNNISKEFIGADNLPAIQDTAPTGVQTNQEIRAEVRKLMDNPGYGDPSHKEHDSLIAAKDALYARLK